MEQINNRIKYFPLKVILTFLVFTELLFFLGPLNYDINNYFILILYLLLANLAFYRGYRKAIFVKKPLNSKRFGSIFLIKLIVFISVLFIIPHFIVSWDLETLSFSSVFDRLLLTLENPKIGQELAKVRNYKGSFTKIYLLFTPVIFAAVPLGIRYWKYLNRKYKYSIFFLILVSIIISIGLGQRARILNTILIIFFLRIAADYSKMIENKRKLVLIFVPIIGLFLIYFVYSNLNRHGIENITFVSDSLYGHYYSGVKSFYLSNISPFVYIPLVEIQSYLSQGYYALALALDESLDSIVFTYGFGNNLFLIKLIGTYLNIDLLSSTYQGILEQKYYIDPLTNWHTIYVWLANDFTFVGSLVIVYYTGYLFADSWLLTIVGKNIIATPLFSLLLISVFFFFANNQVLSFYFIPFLVFFILYFRLK